MHTCTQRIRTAHVHMHMHMHMQMHRHMHMHTHIHMHIHMHMHIQLHMGRCGACSKSCTADRSRESREPLSAAVAWAKEVQ